MKKVSIIVPVYKVENYLRQCVDSLLTQTYTNFEIILVDDGSPDDSPKICDEYALKDNRVKVVHKKNGGLSDARNFGIQASSGDYLAFVDSDDYWDDDMALEKAMSVCDNLDADVLLFGFKKYYQDTKEYETIHMNTTHDDCNRLMPIDDMLKRNVFVTSACNKIVKAKFFKDRDRIRFVKGQLSEDIEYCAQLILKADRFAVLPENFYVYRQGRRDSISANIGTKNLTDIAAVIKKYVDIGKDNDRSLPLLNYLGLQYILWMTCSTYIPKNKIKQVICEMKRLWWITKYDWCPYVRKVKNVRWLGFDTTRHLLGLYKKVKNSRL